jgi:hypothetical protein
VSENGLIGAWRLTAYLDVDGAGGTSEGPLGAAPRGLLIYGTGGYMSVSMMRTGPGADPADLSSLFKGYAGRWRLDGGRLVHDVEVSENPRLVDTVQVRDWALDGDRLTLYGTAPAGGQRRVLVWKRA